jgi:exonuclease SbcD
MDKIRLLHFADLHVGMENYGRLDSATGVNGRVLDFLHRFDELIDYGLEREVDLVIFAGDAFKTRRPNPTYQRAFARRVKRLADAGVPIVLLVGNHDLPTMAQQANSIDIFRTLDVPNVVVGWEEEVHLIETRRGPVQVAAVPYPVRQRLLSQKEYRGLSIRELDDELQTVVAKVIQAMAKQLDPDIPSVLAAHLSVSGALFGSERSVMLGRDAVVLKSVLADPAWDYVALGHIHMHQSLNGDDHPPVVYSGSLERIDSGEEGQPRDSAGSNWRGAKPRGSSSR